MLPKYGMLGASSRLRTMQYLPVLESGGVAFDVHPLLGDQYVSGLYRGDISAVDVFASYARRCRRLLRAGRYDAVWTEKELLPWLPAAIEGRLLGRDLKLIVDYDDAVFHRYDMHRSGLVRAVLSEKIDAVMRRADVVICGSEYLCERARAAGASSIEFVPTVVDLARYSVHPRRNAGALTIGWIGSPTTAGYLAIVASVFRELAAAYKLRFVAIGARPDQLVGTPFEAVAWSEEDEVEIIRSFDIGIMPLPDEPFERGKCGYKIIQYMACGLPVVASPVGANQKIISHGTNGYLATSSSEWYSAMESLILSPDARRSLGRSGRALVEGEYCLQVQASRVAAILDSVISCAQRPENVAQRLV